MSCRNQITLIIWLCLPALLGALLLVGCGKPNFQELVAKGIAAEQAGSVDNATAFYTEALRLKPEDSALRQRLADLYFRQKQYLDAVPHYLTLAKTSPETELFRERSAFLLLELQQYKAAGEILQPELKAHPQSLWAREYTADLFAARFRMNEAVTAYEKLLADQALTGQKRLAVRVKYGRALFAASRQEKALAEFDAVVQSDPKFYDAQIFRANFYLATGNQATAIKAYQEVREHFPKADEPLIGLAAIAVTQQKMDEAVNLYETARQLKPDRIDTLFWLAELYYQKKDTNKLSTLGQNLKANKRESEAMLGYLLGLKKLLNKDYKGALTAFDQMYPFVREYPGILDKMGQCYLELGDAQKAESCFSRVEHDSQTQQQLWISLARAHLSNQSYFRALRLLKIVNADNLSPLLAQAEFGVADYREALKAARVWLRAEPGSIPANLIAAESLQRIDQNAQSQAYLKRIIELDPKSPAAAFAQAQLLLDENKLAEAADLIVKNYDQLGKLSGPNQTLGQIRLYQGNRKEAEKYLRAALKIDPHLASADGMLGLILLEKGEKKEASIALERALKLNQNERSALWGKGMMAYYDSHYDEAIEWLTKLPRTSSNMASVQVIIAYSEFQLNHAALALSAAKHAWEIAPNDPFAAYLTVRAQVWNQQFTEAQASLERCWKIDPNYGPFFHAAALLALAQGNNFSEALKYVEKGVALHPDNFLLRPLQVELLRKLHRYADGETVAKKLLADYPQETMVYTINGNMYLDQAKYEPARQAYWEALKRNPKDAQAQQHILDTYVLEKRVREAAPAMEQILAGDPDNTALRFICARLYAEGGNSKKAVEYYRKILETDPRNVSVLNNLAEILGSDENTLRDAVQMAERAFSRDGKNPAIMDTLGDLYLKSNSPRRAVPLLQAAYSAAPDNPEILFHLAQAHTAADNVKEARACLSQLKTKFPKFDQSGKITALEKTLAAKPVKKH